MPAGLTVYQWHAHEMIFGYAAAVLAGFLLTAVKNWTGVSTLEGKSLCFLWLLWLTARLTINFDFTLMVAMAADIVFSLYLFATVARSVILVRQWKQFEILFLLLFLVLANSLFYAGVAGWLMFSGAHTGIQIGIYTGLFIVIGLILTLGRRVIPFFIEKGVDESVQLRNSTILDNSSQALMLVLILSLSFTSFTSLSILSGGILVLLVLLHGSRLIFWYTPGIWMQPLLWSLFLGYGFIVLGFVLYFMTLFNTIFYYPAIHAMAVGGIGLITLGMMCRVSLGHTGRNIQQLPRLAITALLFLLLAAVIRIAMPLVFSNLYSTWIVLSHGLWIAAFTSFVMAYSKILISKDVA